MMSCVNRSCNRPIATFTDGRLFHFEILSICVPANDSHQRDFDEVPHREGLHFWLCGSCAAEMTLILEPVGGLQLVPLNHPCLEQSLAQSLQHSFDPYHQPSLETRIEALRGCVLDPVAARHQS